MTLQSVGICVSEYRFMKLLLYSSFPSRWSTVIWRFDVLWAVAV